MKKLLMLIELISSGIAIAMIFAIGLHYAFLKELLIDIVERN